MSDKYYEMWKVTDSNEKIVKTSDYKSDLIEIAEDCKSSYARYVIIDTTNDNVVYDSEE